MPIGVFEGHGAKWDDRSKDGDFLLVSEDEVNLVAKNTQPG